MSAPADQVFADLAEYCARTGKMKKHVAEVELGVKAEFFTELLNPDRYRPRIDVDLAVKIARLLNQPVDRVVAMFARVA